MLRFCQSNREAHGRTDARHRRLVYRKSKIAAQKPPATSDVIRSTRGGARGRLQTQRACRVDNEIAHRNAAVSTLGTTKLQRRDTDCASRLSDGRRRRTSAASNATHNDVCAARVIARDGGNIVAGATDRVVTVATAGERDGNDRHSHQASNEDVLHWLLPGAKGQRRLIRVSRLRTRIGFRPQERLTSPVPFSCFKHRAEDRAVERRRGCDGNTAPSPPIELSSYRFVCGRQRLVARRANHCVLIHAIGVTLG